MFSLFSGIGMKVEIALEKGDFQVYPELNESVINVLKDAIQMLNEWLVKTPIQKPWYHARECKRCVERRKRREKIITSPYNWWWDYCRRHVACEFLRDVSLFGNRRKVFIIDMDKKEIFIEAHTNRHCGKYWITKDRIIAELDGTRFQYRPHLNSLPYEPAYNSIIRYAVELLSDLEKILEFRYLLSLYCK